MENRSWALLLPRVRSVTASGWMGPLGPVSDTWLARVLVWTPSLNWTVIDDMPGGENSESAVAEITRSPSTVTVPTNWSPPGAGPAWLGVPSWFWSRLSRFGPTVRV